MWDAIDRQLTKAARTWHNARVLRQLLREQRRTADSLQQIARTLDHLGRLVARGYHVPWEGPLDTVAPPPHDPETAGDQSGVSVLDDQLLGDLEVIKDDYLQRHGQQIDDDDALRVLADHDAALRELQDQQP